jgi:integrase
MKPAYPDYRKKEITKEVLYSKLPAKDKLTFDNFIKTLSCGENKIKDMKSSLLQFRDIIEKPFDKLDLQDIQEYNALIGKSGRKASATNGIKAHVKKFLRFCFKDWYERFDNFRSLRASSKTFNEEKINEKTLLKKEEIETIMKREQNLVKKSFFITLYESGLRPIELRLLKWDDVKFNVDGDISELNIYATKTSRARKVFIKEATFYLKQLFETARDNKYIFTSREGDNKPVGKSIVHFWVNQMGKEHLHRNIYPYLLRHSRATELYLNTNVKIAQKFLGHGKDMSDIYAHLSSKDVKDAIAKTIYNLELTPEETNKVKKLQNELGKVLEIVKRMSEKFDKIETLKERLAQRV